MLHEIVEQIMEISCPEKSVNYQGSQEELIYKIHDYLMEHLSERITIEELAKQFLINPTSLKKIFKQVYGTSIAAHMKEHRMECAAQMLLEGQESISQIAQAVGYESQSRFTTAFKSAYGMLPTAYRKNKK